jgi:hypothetical protein
MKSVIRAPRNRKYFQPTHVTQRKLDNQRLRREARQRRGNNGN